MAKIGPLDQSGMRSPSSKDLRVEGFQELDLRQLALSSTPTQGEDEEEQISLKVETSKEDD